MLDTHVWVWWNMRPEKLSRKVNNLIASGKYEELLLSAISVWEFCKLLEKGRLGISCSPRDWIDAALAMPKLRLTPLTPEIVYLSTTLQLASTDPADQIIVATAQEEGAVIITKDAKICQSAGVRTIW